MLATAAIPVMRDHGGGTVINVSSEAGLVGFPDQLAELDALAAKVEPGCGGLLWFPHSRAGCCLPNRARGAWVGLTAGQVRGHLFRPLLEGIAYEYAVWADLVRGTGQRLHEARALGGGAASPFWNSIKADVVGIEWVPTVRQECGVLGDALIAAAATGHVSDLAAGRR